MFFIYFFKIEVKDGFVMVMFDSIFDVLVVVFVSVFIDYVFVGVLGDEVYGIEKKCKLKKLFKKFDVEFVEEEVVVKLK